MSYLGLSLPQEYYQAVRSPFLHTLRSGNDLYKLIDRDSYFENYIKYFDFLLQRPNLIIKFALLNDNTVLGWSILEGKTIHYVFVKKEVRRQGIGRSLIPKEFDTISHITHKAINVWVKHFPQVRFNPFA